MHNSLYTYAQKCIIELAANYEKLEMQMLLRLDVTRMQM